MSTITKSSGNVFADIGLPDSEALLAKAKLTSKIADAISALNLTQTQAAARIGLTQPKVSELLRGRFDGFSMEKLILILNALGYDVQISTSPSARHHPRLAVR